MSEEINYKQILTNLLVDLSLADHLGDVYEDCYRAAKLAGLDEGYDVDKEYFYGGDLIDAGSYDHFAHYLRKEKGALYFWEDE